MADSILTVERVLQLLDYDRDSGLFTWKKPTNRRIRPGSVAGCKATGNNEGYILLGIDGDVLKAHRVAFFLEHGRWPVGDIDHIDGDRSNNAISNLRETDRSGNMQNLKKARKDNGTKVLGVSAIGGRYRASIKVGKKQVHLGCFASTDEAHAAYLKAKRELHPNCTI